MPHADGVGNRQANSGFSTAEKPWLPVPYAHAMHAADAQERRPDSILNHYRAVLSFRKSHGALRDGDMTFLKTNLDVLAFTRHKGEHTLLIVFNLTRKPVEFSRPQGHERNHNSAYAGVRAVV